MEATLKIPCNNPRIIRKSLEPDIDNKKDVRVSMKTNKNELMIQISTKRISYLKAVINSYLSLIKTLKELEEL